MTIFDYTDYRNYLKDYYQDQKNKHSYFTYRYFSKLAGIGGTNYFQMIMSGQRNLSTKTIPKFIKALKLKKKEAEYFENLVLFNQSQKTEDKALYFDKLINIKPSTKISELEKDRFLYFTNKYIVILREMVALPHFKENHEWIQKSLGNALSIEQIKKAINILIKLKLLKRNKNNKLVQSFGSIITPEDVESLEVYKYYHSILNSAKEAILEIPYQKRGIASLTIPVPEKLIPTIKEMIQKNLEDIVQLVNKEMDVSDEVYQLNTILFPVTRTKTHE